MFRFFTLLVTFFAILSAVSGTYQRVLHVDVQACTELATCFTQASQLFAQISLRAQDIVWLTHYLSAAVVVLFLLCMLLTSFWTKGSKLAVISWTLVLTGLLVLQICLAMHQEWLGTTVNHLAHYLVSALAIFVAFHIYLRSKTAFIKRTDAQPRWLVRSAIALLFVQIVLGAWLTANNAGLVCDGFPRCLNSWWPQASYQYAFDLFSSLSFSAKVAVHWTHRLFAIVAFVVIALLMLIATGSSIKQVRLASYVIGILLLLQVAAGIGLVKLELPIWLVVIHSMTAIVLMLPLLAISFYFKYQSLETKDDELLVADSELSLEVDDELSLDTSAFERLDKEPAVVTEVVEPLQPQQESLYLRLKSQLGKTRSGLGTALSAVSLGSRKIDRNLLEEIETSLLMADVGMEATTEIIAKLQDSVEKHQLKDASALSELLKQQLLELLEPVSEPLVIPKKDGPFVILVVGVNGVGKTTTIGKLAQRLQRQGHSVMLAAGDTFRAAAVEQLQTWGERNQIHVVAQHTGADSASVIFDGVQSAQAKGIDVLIADTAGRLHTKSNLMEELKKVKRIMGKLDPTAPHEVLLVLDAGTGQNALSQAEHFNNTVALTGLALTKLDGTAKGGIIFALAKQRGIPIRFLGVGESIDDLQDFNAEQFIDALFMENES
ncbi:MAG: fused signal recognition particle receptor [Methyloprofundus sp.]|nr:MAG: fused signal recognition particle receptor [Methyloprofundus sp.]